MKKVAAFFIVAIFALGSIAVANANPASKSRLRHIRGEVTSVDTSASTVTFLRLNGKVTTMTVTPKTVIRKNGHRVDIDRLALGDRGHAKLRCTEEGPKALKIFVHTPFFTGRITEVTSDTVTVKRAKITREFIVDDNTKIKRKGIVAELSDLKIGDAAKVFYNKTEDGDLLARRIRSGGRKH